MSGGSGSDPKDVVTMNLTKEQAMDLMTALHHALGLHGPKDKDEPKADASKG